MGARTISRLLLTVVAFRIASRLSSFMTDHSLLSSLTYRQTTCDVSEKLFGFARCFSYCTTAKVSCMERGTVSRPNALVVDESKVEVQVVGIKVPVKGVRVDGVVLDRHCTAWGICFMDLGYEA